MTLMAVKNTQLRYFHSTKVIPIPTFLRPQHTFIESKKKSYLSLASRMSVKNIKFLQVSSYKNMVSMSMVLWHNFSHLNCKFIYLSLDHQKFRYLLSLVYLQLEFVTNIIIEIISTFSVSYDSQRDMHDSLYLVQLHHFASLEVDQLQWGIKKTFWCNMYISYNVYTVSAIAFCSNRKNICKSLSEIN